MDKFLRGVPPTKRLLYDELKKFIDDKQDFLPPIGLIAGLRQTGKTTLLKQLAIEYIGIKRVMYINFRDNAVYTYPNNDSLQKLPANKVIYEILAEHYRNYDLFLLDEITFLEDYEVISGNLYDSSGGSGWKYKVIMTGSSPFHIRSLSSGSLGGGRCRLFRLSVLKFVEYLHISKNVSYTDYSCVTRDDFIDYLTLKNLPTPALKTFDSRYFVNYYDDVVAGDETTCHSRGISRLGSEDLVDLSYVLAYQLAYRVGFQKLAKINAGKYELGHFGGRSNFDLSHSLVSVSSKNINRIKSKDKSEDIANLLHFLIESDIVNIETELGSDEQVAQSPIMLSRNIRHFTSSDFHKFFETHSISVNSPLLYSKLGDDILSIAGISLEEFYIALQSRVNTLLGDLLEVYLRGGVAELDTTGLPYISKKLSIGHDAEIDIISTNFRIMCESTVKNKDKGKVYLADYYRDEEFIRVCTTSDLIGVKGCYLMIPWYLFCCMIDTRDVLKLPKTKSSDFLGDVQENVVSVPGTVEEYLQKYVVR